MDLPMRTKAARARSTVAVPSDVRRAPSSTIVTTFAVSRWISSISSPIVDEACCEPSASLRTSSATTGSRGPARPPGPSGSWPP
jgi:hypothetical protein